ncbi:unnamed protein product [Paramecium pentaurelia]|uniref:Galectin n=1 Tax=Paramecium pentaurelia TaxID=43138 RepID=A0A8S1WH27_9CILI|nr:unnamed protein product [Paramecium pentaurelia]
MAPMISFLKIIFLNSIFYQNCHTNLESDCRYQEFNVQGITTSTVVKCGSDSKNIYMGPFGEGSIVTKTFSNIPPNIQIELKFKIAKIDSWDSETLTIWLNDQQLEHYSFTSHQGTHICQLSEYEDLIIQIAKTFQTTTRGLTLKFKDTLDQASTDESWGLGDVFLRVINPCVNFYSECNYQGEIFTICKGGQVIQQRNIPFEIKSISFDPSIMIKIKDPNYYGGVLKDITTSEPCLDSYKFPKQVQPA